MWKWTLCFNSNLLVIYKLSTLAHNSQGVLSNKTNGATSVYSAKFPVFLDLTVDVYQSILQSNRKQRLLLFSVQLLTFAAVCGEDLEYETSKRFWYVVRVRVQRTPCWKQYCTKYWRVSTPGFHTNDRSMRIIKKGSEDNVLKIRWTKRPKRPKRFTLSVLYTTP